MHPPVGVSDDEADMLVACRRPAVFCRRTAPDEEPNAIPPLLARDVPRVMFPVMLPVMLGRRIRYVGGGRRPKRTLPRRIIVEPSSSASM